MKGKLLFLAGTATGFVLGSRAGRQAYDRICARAQAIWRDPNTHEVISQAESIAKDAASVTQATVSDLLDRTEASVKNKSNKTHPSTDADSHEP